MAVVSELQQNLSAEHSELRVSMCKTDRIGVDLKPQKPWPPLKNLLDLGWGMNTWRIIALGGG